MLEINAIPPSRAANSRKYNNILAGVLAMRVCV